MKMSPQPAPITAAHNQCRVLASLKTHPLDSLLVQARRQYTTPDEIDILEAALRGILSDAEPVPMEHKLAELLYFRQGYMLVEHQLYNKMTRFQMEHECLARALLSHEQLPVTSDLGLRVFLKADREQIPPAQNPLVFRPPPPSRRDSGYGNGYCTDDNEETKSSLEGQDGDDDNSEKATYVQVWQPELGIFITSRY